MADATALLPQARQAAADRRYGRAVMLVRRLLELNPPLGPRWEVAAKLASSLQDPHAAAQAQARYLETGATKMSARLYYVRYLHESGRFEEARDLIEQLYEEAPDNAKVVYASAYVHARLGNDDLSIERYRESALMDVEQSVAWSVIMRMKKATPDDPDIDHMRRADAWLETAPPRQRAPVKFALGYAMEHLGDYDAAFAYIREANRLMAEHHKLDPARSARLLNQVVQARPPETVRASRGAESDRPIFVAGAPRAGTTLVETILSAHSDVVGGAEVSFMTVASYPAVHAAEDAPDDPEGALTRMLGADPWRRIGSTYVSLASERFGESGRFVDSATSVPLQIGLILSALPNAKVVWLTRDRRDAIWGIYKLLFAQGQTFSYDLNRIRDRLDWLDQLRDRYTAAAPDQILPVQYEDLARDPETWIRRILDHCGLAYEDSVREFHKSSRIVSSASTQQVREPINTKSLGSWRRYEKHLDPIYRDLLGPDYDKAA